MAPYKTVHSMAAYMRCFRNLYLYLKKKNSLNFSSTVQPTRIIVVTRGQIPGVCFLVYPHHNIYLVVS